MKEAMMDSATNTGQILLVEDDLNALTLLAEALSAAGHHVTTASDGETALELLMPMSGRAQPFDIVVTDMRMRAVDGIEVLRVARAQTDPPLVILLTGFATLDTALCAFRNGAYDYLLKPCSPPDLLESIASALQHRSEQQQRDASWQSMNDLIERLQQSLTPAPPAPAAQSSAEYHNGHSPLYEIGVLCIDRFKQVVLLNNERLHVTRIEYILLAQLAAAEGEPVAHRELVRRTHEQDVENRRAYELLKQHISNLRRKLPAGYLQTVRGLGYCLIDPNATSAD
jgi:two-component system OmpR family response regulator